LLAFHLIGAAVSPSYTTASAIPSSLGSPHEGDEDLPLGHLHRTSKETAGEETSQRLWTVACAPRMCLCVRCDFVSELSLECDVLLQAPLGDLRSTDEEEDPRGQRLSEDGEDEPRGQLAGVVGAGDVLEEEATWDAPRFTPRRPQPSKEEMAVEVSRLRCQEEERGDGDEGGRLRLSVEGVIEEVGDHQTPEYPVVEGVLEDVAYGHRVQGEEVDVDRLQLPFEVVEEDAGEGDFLCVGVGGDARKVGVAEGGEEEEEGVDEDGPEVFGEEDRPPRYLWAQVLEDH
jgi:hypothetical protein